MPARYCPSCLGRCFFFEPTESTVKCHRGSSTLTDATLLDSVSELDPAIYETPMPHPWRLSCIYSVVKEDSC